MTHLSPLLSSLTLLWAAGPRYSLLESYAWTALAQIYPCRTSETLPVNASV